MTSVRYLLLIPAFAVTASAHAQEEVALSPPGPPNQGVHPLGVLILAGVAAVFGTIIFFLLRWAVRQNRKNNRGVVEHLVQSRPDLPAEIAVRLDAAWQAAFLSWLAVGLLKMGAVAYLVLLAQTPRNQALVTEHWLRLCWVGLVGLCLTVLAPLVRFRFFLVLIAGVTIAGIDTLVTFASVTVLAPPGMNFGIAVVSGFISAAPLIPAILVFQRTQFLKIVKAEAQSLAAAQRRGPPTPRSKPEPAPVDASSAPGMISFRCTTCDKRLTARDVAKGRRIVCPRCRTAMTVPG